MNFGTPIMEGVKTKFGRELTHSVGNLSDMSNALTIDQNLQIKQNSPQPAQRGYYFGGGNLRMAHV